MIQKVILGDCLEKLNEVPDKSVDMVCVDLPYQITKNKWDSLIDLDKLWTHYLRIGKDNTPFIFTASQPFTTILINSNFNLFRYCLVWDKKGTTGFQNAKKMPLKRHEDIVVFYRNLPTYNPQKEIRGKPRKKGGSKIDNGCYGELRSSESFNNEYYPTSIIEISNAVKIGLVHPTQKPVPLMEYLIKTYSNEGDLVLDNCAGSFTTAVACDNLNRNWICIEKELKYCEIGLERINKNREISKKEKILSIIR